MIRTIWSMMAMLALFEIQPPIAAGQGVLDKNKNLVRLSARHVPLGVVDGELKCFVGTPLNPRNTPTPVMKTRSYFFRYKYEPGTDKLCTLQVFVTNQEAGTLKEHDALHDWFLTGDYSVNPPRVILTAKREKYSLWRIDDVRRGRGGMRSSVRIRNENDLKKAAYLSWEETGELKLMRATIGDMRRPILVETEGPSFEFREYEGPDGK